MASSRVKQSGSKIVPHSDFRAGTTLEDVIEKKKCGISRIGAWNVRNMKQIGKLENLKVEMNRLDLDLVGISEVRWPNSGDSQIVKDVGCQCFQETIRLAQDRVSWRWASNQFTD